MLHVETQGAKVEEGSVEAKEAMFVAVYIQDLKDIKQHTKRSMEKTTTLFGTSLEEESFL